MKSNEFTESTNLYTLTTNDVVVLQKKARGKIRDIFNQSFPLSVKTIARGGEGMRGLVFTFGPDAKQLSGKQGEWAAWASDLEDALAAQGMQGELTQGIWKNTGELRARPKVLLNVDLIAKLEELYFTAQDREHFNKNEQFPQDANATIKQVNSL